MSAVASGQFADFLDALVPTFGNYIGGSELETEIRAGLVAPHEDDALGAEAFGGEHCHQPHGSIADDRDRRALVDATLDRRVIAGAEDVGECEQ